MVFKCLLGASHLNIISSKPARSRHHWARRLAGSAHSTLLLLWAPRHPDPLPLHRQSSTKPPGREDAESERFSTLGLLRA